MNNINDRSDEMMKIFKRNYNRESEMKTLIKRWETSSNGLISVREAIAALESMQAPLPEDVADAVSVLRAEYDPHWIADMLERLWRENKARIDKQDKTMLAYESRIKRLDAALAEIETEASKYGMIGAAKVREIKARAGDIRDDHCLTPDEYDGKARAGK